jgi:site-specific recombinase XerD
VTARQPEGIADPAGLAAWTDLKMTLVSSGAADMTIRNYGWCIAQFCLYLDGTPLLAADRDDIRGYIAWLREHGGAGGGPAQRHTLDTRYRALRRFYRFCATPEAGYITASPVHPADAPAPGEKITPMISPADWRKLRAACAGTGFDERRDLAMILLARSPGGPRASELTGIRTGDLALDRQRVLIRQGKWARDRLITPGPAATQALLRYLAARPRHRLAAATDALFLGKAGPLTRSGFQKLLDRRCDQAGIGHVNPHRLRKQAQIEFRLNGGQTSDAKQLFGWRSDRMSEQYEKAAAVALAADAGARIAALMEAG